MPLRRKHSAARTLSARDAAFTAHVVVMIQSVTFADAMMRFIMMTRYARARAPCHTFAMLLCRKQPMRSTTRRNIIRQHIYDMLRRAMSRHMPCFFFFEPTRADSFVAWRSAYGCSTRHVDVAAADTAAAFATLRLAASATPLLIITIDAAIRC